MAYSEVASDMKSEAIKQLLGNELFIKALNATEIENADDLVGTHIFKYGMSPEYITYKGTFITFTVQIPRVSGDKQNLHPLLEVRIVTHNDNMKINPKEIKTTANRNDFLSQIIDRVLNSNETTEKKFGFFGQLELIRNEEGIFNKDWCYRYMQFETFDFNQGYNKESNKKFFAKYGYDIAQ